VKVGTTKVKSSSPLEGLELGLRILAMDLGLAGLARGEGAAFEVVLLTGLL
jgi:hypothetical protein